MTVTATHHRHVARRTGSHAGVRATIATRAAAAPAAAPLTAPVSAPTAAPISAPAAGPVSAPAAAAVSAPVGVRIQSRLSGNEWTIAPGATATLRRSLAAEVPLTHPQVFRAGHALLDTVDGRWVLTVTEPGREMFVQGRRVRRMVLTDHQTIRLGAAADGEDVDLWLQPAPTPTPTPGRPAGRRPDRTSHLRPPQLPAPPPAGGPYAGNVAPGRHRSTRRRVTATTSPILTSSRAGATTDVTGPPLTVTVGNQTQVLPGHQGVAYRLGHTSECDIRLAVATASRHHLTFSWDGDQWLLADTSTRGTYRTDGTQIPAPATAFGRTATLRLGHPKTGEPVILTYPARRAHDHLATILVVVTLLLVLGAATPLAAAVVFGL